MPREIIKEEETTLPKVKMLLEQRLNEGELSHLQRLTYDYSMKFSKLSIEKADELQAKLRAEGVSPSITSQIVNIMPRSVEELRTIFAGENKPMLPSELEKILGVINSSR